MNRIDRAFAAMRREKRTGLIAYLTCGDPDLETTRRAVAELERAGADAIELGVPFSDPIADGPVIQAAAQRALRYGTTVEDVIEVTRQIRQTSEVPLIAFSYLNPILRYGIERFAADAASAGFDSLLLTDLPPEAAGEIRRTLHAHKLGLIFLLAPTSDEKRRAMIDRLSDGFVYYVSTTGVTGARRDLDESLLARLDEIRPRMRKPLAIGFGVSTHEHYQALSGRCQAVVVGSAIVRAMNEGESAGAPERAAGVVRSILGR